MVEGVKAPNSKHQHPEKLQLPGSKMPTPPAGFGIWSLKFLWGLDVGAWSIIHSVRFCV
jgi:hypothetical protein